MKNSKSLAYILSTILLAAQPSICLAADGQAANDAPSSVGDNSGTGSKPKYHSVNSSAPTAAAERAPDIVSPVLRQEPRIVPKYSDPTGTSALEAPSRIQVPREMRPVPGQQTPTTNPIELDSSANPQAGSLPAVGTQSPDLRGAIPPTGAPQGTNSAQSSAQPSVAAGPENATDAVNTDFAKHAATTAAIKKGFPAEPSGASNDKAAAVLTKETPGGPGPSTVSSNSERLDEIQLNHPALQSLISVNNYLNPFQLDASVSDVMNLRDALLFGLDQNLDLAISRTNAKAQQNAYYSALGNFLPDPTMGFSEYFTNGRIGLPFSPSTLLGTGLSSLGSSSSSATFPNNGTTTIRIHHPFEIMHGGMEFYAYRGGSILFGALQSKHNYKAAKLQEKASLRDMLMTVTQNYYNLVLAEALLQIRIQAVRTSNEQLRRNLDRFHSGLATNLDVLQSRTQLSRDRQNLVDQQTSRRSNSITLAQSLYMNLGQDIIPIEMNVRKVRLVDPRLNIADFLQLAIDNRPELKQYEELRLAAKKAILVAAAKLQPTVLLSGAEYGIGPPSNVQGLGIFAVNINWRLKGFGTVDAFSVNQARWQARQAQLNAEKELQTVLSQVRNSYLQILDKERNIEESSNEVESSLEELRLAELRKSSGLGINLDIITAQRDYTQALVDKAQAIIQFNIAQAQLVHDMGLISVDALTSGRLLSKSSAPRK